MSYRVSTLYLAVSNLLLGVAILVFAAGFFPYKPFIPGYNDFSAQEAKLALEAPFDRVIFMVVDALRSDFVYSNESEFKFLQSLIRKGHALPFTAHASSPTITMPKIKAITTGSVPSFLDVILNFAESDRSSTLAHVDTWLHQLQRKPGGGVIMHGDDTWLKLFPDFFKRADGTSSFFVSDFTEVDKNVTRHLDVELRRSDWNGWIMHYLGLDHIGHKSGPQSPHMRPKQREMDMVVQQVYNSIKLNSHLQSTIFVLCGDHGMNEAGNHGGASPGETSPALLFISPKLQPLSPATIAAPSTAAQGFEFYNLVQQSDIAPTLSALLGLPLPMNNLGVLIPDFLDLWQNGIDKAHLVKQNVRQVHRILHETLAPEVFSEQSIDQLDCSSASNDIKILQCGWLAQRMDPGDIDGQIDLLYRYLRIAQEMLSSAASNYDLPKLYFGVCLCSFVFLVQLLHVISSLQTSSERTGFASIGLITFLYSMMMFASSFVEEEHQFWYWIGGSLMVYIFLLKSGQNIGLFILAMLLLRFVRRWNQTGQKFAGSPDIGRTLLGANPIGLWVLVLVTHLYFGFRLVQAGLCTISPSTFGLLSTAITLTLFLFKLSFTSADAPELMGGFASYFGTLSTPAALILQARIAFSLIGLTLCVVIVTLPKNSKRTSKRTSKTIPKGQEGPLRAMGALFTLFLLAQTRVNNIPLFLILEVLAGVIRRGGSHSTLNLVEHATCSLVLQYTSFFAFGGTNSIASIDLSNAYNGVSGYNVLAVGFLTFIGNWAGPLWWTISASISPLRNATAYRSFARYAYVHNLFTAGALTATMAACTLLRTHLFIWTVFSPKYLYIMAWSFLQHMGVNFVFSGAMSRFVRIEGI